MQLIHLNIAHKNSLFFLLGQKLFIYVKKIYKDDVKGKNDTYKYMCIS